MAGHLSNKTWYNKQRPFVRLNGFGDMIPGSIVFRDRMPKNGTWRQLGFINACCNGIGDSIITFTNNSTNTITSIQSANINWTGSLGVDDPAIISFVIPGGMDQTIVITDNASVDIAFAAATVQGDGVIAPTSGNDTGGTYTLTTTSVPNSQYMVTITDV